MNGDECPNCPDHKICPNCQKDLPASDYHVSNFDKGYLQSHCKVCARERSRANYHKNKDNFIRQKKERDKLIDSLILERKDRPCMDCGIRYPPYVMDFDHRDPSDKDYGVCQMRRRHMGIDKIKREMDKCDVVCSNCHRIRTNVRTPARYNGMWLDMDSEPSPER